MKQKVKVGINGIGRIGRTILRQYCDSLNKNYDFEVVALNNPGDFKVPVHLLNYDSTHGIYKDAGFHFEVEKEESGEGRLELLGQEGGFACFTRKNPQDIPWEDLGVEVVLDATGIFKDKEALSKHLKGSVKKVILCAPGKNVDATIVMGVNESVYNPSRHEIISNASCTTNCLAPIVKVLHENWKIERGIISTIHAYTSDQNILDGRHKDLRRARGAGTSIIPTNTGAARALGKVFPDLEGKFDGLAYRVPVPNVSVVDLNLTFENNVNPSISEINEKLEDGAHTALKGILGINKEELVSIDFNGRKESSIVDLHLTNSIRGMIKVVAWYDNEVGFSCRVLDLANLVAKGL